MLAYDFLELYCVECFTHSHAFTEAYRVTEDPHATQGLVIISISVSLPPAASEDSHM